MVSMTAQSVQVFEALDRANQVRQRRKQLKAALHAGTVRFEDVIREPEWFLFSMPAYELVGLVPRFGVARVNRVLRRAEIWPLRETGILTVRQRARLFAEVRECQAYTARRRRQR